jgi:hypothetical protein
MPGSGAQGPGREHPEPRSAQGELTGVESRAFPTAMGERMEGRELNGQRQPVDGLVSRQD